MRAGVRIARTAETTLRQRSVIGAAYKNSFLKANELCIGTIQAPLALATWERTGSRLIGSVCWRWNKLSRKADRTTALFLDKRLLKLACSTGRIRRTQRRTFGFVPKVRLRTCRRTRSSNLTFARAVEETSIPVIGLREANSREARVVGCLLGHLRSV